MSEESGSHAEGVATPAVEVDFGFVAALTVVLAVGAAFVLSGFVSAASQPLGWALACATVAALVQPVIGWLSRHMRRGFAVVLTLIGIAILLGGAWAGVANTVADNIDVLKEEAPIAAAELEDDNELARDFRLEERVTTFVDDLDDRLGTRAQLARSTSTISTYVVTGVLTVFFIAYGDRIVTGGLRQIRDERRRRRTTTILSRAITSWRRYALIAIAELIVVTLVAWVVLWAIDLPAPFVLALLIGGFSVIPFAGVVLGGIPAILFAAATADLGTVGAVLAVLVAIQLVDIFVVRPRVDRGSVYLGPALPIIVGLIGFELYGLGGVIYGVLLLILAIAIIDQFALEDGEPTSSELAATSNTAPGD